MKLATIMTITNADRASDLHALDRRFLQETPEGMLFRVLGLTKTRRSGGPREVLHPKFTLPSEYSVTIFEGVTEALYPVGQKTTPVCSSEETSQGSHSSYHLQMAEGDSL